MDPWWTAQQADFLGGFQGAILGLAGAFFWRVGIVSGAPRPGTADRSSYHDRHGDLRHGVAGRRCRRCIRWPTFPCLPSPAIGGGGFCTS